MTRANFFAFSRSVALAVAIVTLAFHAARADVTFTEVVEPDGRTNMTVIRMTVTPAAEPVPALRHRLLAHEIDLKPGNAAPYYYRAMMSLKQEREALRQEFDEETQLYRWYATGVDAIPLADLPLENVRRAVEISTGGHTGQELASAVARRECDWQTGIEDIRGPEVIAFRLDEFQDSRQLARMLSLRTRLAVAEGHYDNAIDAMRMNYRLGRDVAAEPILVCGLIGLAIVGTADGNLIELIAADESPNMYWALTELPQPLVDMRPAARFEMSIGPRILPFMHDAETTDRSPGEWNRIYKESVQSFASMTGVISDPQLRVRSELGATAFALAGYPHAKARLVEMGMDRQRVERMPVGQVLAIYTERTYQRLADEYEKLWYVPFPDMLKREPELERQVEGARMFTAGADREVLPIVTLLLPATQAVRTAQVRTERDVAALRVIEALRIYAAGHERRLPASLDHVTEVPIPLNPATGRPFAYRLDGNTGILELPPSDGIRNYNRRFEIRIADK